ncbi:MAG TPA: class I SAM-dependent methyltransferase [Kofleriaceae bacterium]|nr:class I SAM-dependent methyltransferase [Kofleriaceae bacterium]
MDRGEPSGATPLAPSPGGRRASWYSLLRCPACRAVELARDISGVRCRACGVVHPDRGGYLDMLASSALGEPTPSTPEQRLMESELVARLYERFWRPAFVRLLAGRGAGGATGGFAGEFFIHKNALGMDERGGPWLDLSSGPGVFTRAMASAAPGDWVIGLDISRAMVEAAARRVNGYGNVGLVRADAHDLPLASGCFAGVNNTGALHVYDDPEAVFSEVIRVLAPGGIYVGSTFAQSRSPVGRLTSRVAGIRRFDPPELRSWLSRIGFADYEEIRLGDSMIFRVRKP